MFSRATDLDFINVSFGGGPDNGSSYPVGRAAELLNFQFLSELTFSDWKVESAVRQLCKKAERKHLVSLSSKWLGKFHKKELEFPSFNSFVISWIDSYIGYGVFASKNIPAWSYIGEYTGILRRRKAVWMDENDYCFRYPLPLFTIKYFTIDSGNHGNFTRFINHSDNPNAEAIGVFHDGLFHVIIRSIKPIKAGEEICYHYGPLYWKHRKKRIEFVPREL
ncbi:SET domain-containing protein [Chlamydiifrater phoenicopteri]|uniref:SET domain-containing protein n=1 Tax=Chlamydiifrater phoenicopteri TaxID=2681469 RepID=UPI001BCC906B|nr:SET domain-containing protein [Chlamydiifrater phoenicopteri]